MASAGKKGKKSKGKTLALNDFLQETPGPAPTIPIRKSGLNWAEEVEDAYENYDTSRTKQQVVLPTAPKAARGIDDYSDKIPNQPPYIAYLSNLPYDVDEEEIAQFFNNMKITNMRIPKDDRPGETPKLRGFGYVEFEDKESLLCALAIPDCTLKNRRIRIEVATSSDNERRRGGKMENYRDRSDRPDTSSGDWRSEGRVGGDSGDNERRFNRDRERDRDRDAPSDRGGWRDGERPSFRDNNRDNERGRFERSYGGGSRRNDRDDRNGGMTRSRDDGPTERPEPRARPKLNLAPRTKPIENVAAPAPEVTEPSKSTTGTAASIFGNAKPVDTTAKEREIEERLAKEQEKSIESGAEKKEIKKDEDKQKRDDYGRRSPRSPERKYSPRRMSPYRNKYSPERNRSNEGRRASPERRRGSPERRRPSPDRRRISPERRRGSPDRKKGSPDRRRISPERRRVSPDMKRGSPDRKRGSPDRKRVSPDRKRGSPERRRSSPDKRRSSPERRRVSPDKNRGPPIRRIDDKKGPPRGDKIIQKEKIEKTEKRKDEKPARDYTERDMPKLKQPEPQNFITSNQYAYLDTDDVSD